MKLTVVRVVDLRTGLLNYEYEHSQFTVSDTPNIILHPLLEIPKGRCKLYLELQQKVEQNFSLFEIDLFFTLL